jgi:hypothetical protein
MAHGYNPSDMEGRDWENHDFRPAQANSLRDPISKITKQNGVGDVTHVVEYLLCKCEDLSSNPKFTKK